MLVAPLAALVGRGDDPPPRRDPRGVRTGDRSGRREEPDTGDRGARELRALGARGGVEAAMCASHAGRNADAGVSMDDDGSKRRRRPCRAPPTSLKMRRARSPAAHALFPPNPAPSAAVCEAAHA
uniref:Uncharacterized protein n=1 Tax=Bicosoecida sp. CB-2014 TaxID=1486930 RepID=A0A7S1CIB1_9STRA